MKIARFGSPKSRQIADLPNLDFWASSWSPTRAIFVDYWSKNGQSTPQLRTDPPISNSIAHERELRFTSSVLLIRQNRQISQIIYFPLAAYRFPTKIHPTQDCNLVLTFAGATHWLAIAAFLSNCQVILKICPASDPRTVWSWQEVKIKIALLYNNWVALLSTTVFPAFRSKFWPFSNKFWCFLGFSIRRLPVL